VQRDSLVTHQLATGARTDDLGLNACSNKWGWESCGWLFAESTLNLDLVYSLATLIGFTSGNASSAHCGIGTRLSSWSLRASGQQ
jgi:hypothetical protein